LTIKELTPYKYFSIIIFLLYSTIHSQQLIDLDKLKKEGVKTIIPLQISYKQNLLEKDSLETIKTLLKLSQQTRIKLDYGAAFNYVGEALFLSEQLNDTLLMAETHEEYGILNYLFKQDNAAGTNLKKSHHYFLSLFNKNEIPPSRLYKSYYNLILYYQRIENKEVLVSYIDSCKILAKRHQLDDSYEIYLNEKQASVLKWKGQFRNSIILLNKSIIELEKSDPNNSFLIILYGSLANIYNTLEDYENAILYFNKSIQTQDQYGEHTFYKSFIHTSYASLLYKTGNHKDAYTNLQAAKKIGDKYLNPRNEDNQNFLTLKDHYRDQLDESNQQINLQRLELSHNKQEILRFRIILTAFIFLVITLGIFIFFKIKSNKQQLKQEASENEIATKNKELTDNILHLIEKEEIIDTLKNHLKQISKESNTKSLLKSIDKQSESLWNSFNQRFTVQNKDFYKRLQKQAPNLSASELKLCALIKLNFTGQEMAYLLGISLGSVHVARHRLRKKINLDRKMNLTTFIASI
jgi:DNA-binding CsgD family transcriptional regulator